MKRIYTLICCSFLFCQAYSQQISSINNIADPEEGSTARPALIAIIPEPVSLVKSGGYFHLPENITIQAGKSEEIKRVVDALQSRISTSTGSFISTYSISHAQATIRLIINKDTNPLLAEEGYQLSVTPKTIVIRANKAAGLFYGVQTLIQLFPKEIESKELVENVKWVAPCVEITDYPRVGWRGLMFDVVRHFFTKDEVKQFIDAMVRYKYNILHLHLTDDEGWRIEIKGLPKLTEIGAWNVKKVGTFGNFTPPAPDEPRNYGGFYTQDDIREIVNYAKDRFVNILPEIDVPAHSLAAITAYPDLSTTQGKEITPRVRSGERIMDWSRGAPPTAFIDNTLSPANERVYTFLDTIITQVAALFPFEYIHMGGDEAPFNYWQKSDAIKVLMKREGIKDMRGVQGYFEKRVQKIVESKGKKFIGWDEILYGDIPSSAAVMNWRGIQYGIQATRDKHEVVMCPSAYAYLDYMQGDPVSEPHVYASLRLSKTYEFDPVPAGADPMYIKGGQANLWTEQVYNIRQAEYMVWPRGFAIAECLWSPKEKKNWTNFLAKMELHFKRLDMSETKYSPAVYDPIVKASRSADNQLMVELSTEMDGLDIYYSFDNSSPDRFYPKYTEKLVVPKDADLLRIITYKGKDPIGRMLNITIEDLNKRAGKK